MEDPTLICIESALKLDDLNQLIKLFSFRIQDRIQQLDRNQPGIKKIYPHEETQMNILQRYANYKIQNPSQLKFIKKFCKRIIEIFNYFRMQSKNVEMLAIIEQRIIGELDTLLQKQPLIFVQIVNFISNLIRKPLSHQKRRKIQLMRKLCPQGVPLQKMKQNFSSCNLNIKKIEQKRSKILTQKRMKPNEQELYRLYNILQLEKHYIQRYIQNLTIFQKEAVDKISKDMLKKNEKIIQNINQYSKKYNQKNKKFSITEPKQQIQQKNTQYTEQNNNQMAISEGVLRETFYKKNNNIMQININTDNIKGKMSTKAKNSDALVNNWLIKKQLPPRPKKIFKMNTNHNLVAHNNNNSNTRCENSAQLYNSNTYNFCIKESLKFQNRKFKRFLAKQNEETQYQKSKYGYIQTQSESKCFLLEPHSVVLLPIRKQQLRSQKLKLPVQIVQNKKFRQNQFF